MKRTATRLLLVTLLFTSFLSCKKDKDSKYYMKLKVDGNWITWKDALGELGPDLADGSKTNLGVSGYAGEGTTSFDISIQMDGPNVPQGTYTTDNPAYWMIVSYFTTAANGDLQYFEVETQTGQPEAKYTVNITSITAETISGTFTGNYLYDDMDDETISVTEGEFHVRRIR